MAPLVLLAAGLALRPVSVAPPPRPPVELSELPRLKRQMEVDLQWAADLSARMRVDLERMRRELAESEVFAADCRHFLIQMEVRLARGALAGAAATVGARSALKAPSGGAAR